MTLHIYAEGDTMPEAMTGVETEYVKQWLDSTVKYPNTPMV